MRIPALVWPAPRGRDPGVHRRTFRVIDLPATVFDLLGVDPGLAPGTGTSVLADGPVAAYMETLFPWFRNGWSPLHALQIERWKYVEAPQPELYDLAADPGERTNVIDAHPERAQEMAGRLGRNRGLEDAWRSIGPHAKSGKSDPRTRRRQFLVVAVA